MSATRSDEELKTVRQQLFKTFPHAPSCPELFAFQKTLVDELLTIEHERRLSNDWALREHAHMVRLYGDALAFGQMSVYAIRQLARNSGKPPGLSGQGTAFDLAMQCCEVVNQHGVPGLLADLTNVLKNGDLVLCVDENAPQIVECKLGAVKDIRFERQGRRGRQLARIESIGRFLRHGKGKIFGDERERQTVELKRTPQYDFKVVEQVVSAALDHRPTTLLVSDWELYSAALLGETSDSASVMEGWKIRPREGIAIGSASEPLRGGWPDIRPPILWDMSEDARWALMEGDVALTHAVRVNAFVGLRRGEIFVHKAIEMPGPFGWGYEMMIGHDPMVVSPNMMLEVIYAHETIESAGQRLLELAESTVAAMTGDSNG